MLEHADRNNSGEWPSYIAIVLLKEIGSLA
jgi:hypothetical protein